MYISTLSTLVSIFIVGAIVFLALAFFLRYKKVPALVRWIGSSWLFAFGYYALRLLLGLIGVSACDWSGGPCFVDAISYPLYEYVPRQLNLLILKLQGAELVTQTALEGYLQWVWIFVLGLLTYALVRFIRNRRTPVV